MRRKRESGSGDGGKGNPARRHPFYRRRLTVPFRCPLSLDLPPPPASLFLPGPAPQILVSHVLLPSLSELVRTTTQPRTEEQRESGFTTRMGIHARVVALLRMCVCVCSLLLTRLPLALPLPRTIASSPSRLRCSFLFLPALSISAASRL